MRRTISLDGEWERRDFLDEAWRWSDALRPSARDGTADGGPPVQAGVSAGWRSARVPGSAIDDAWRGGEIANPYVDRNSPAAEWILHANVGAVAALEVGLADARPVGWPERTGAVYLSGNVVTVLPGETQVVRADWRDVPLADRALHLCGWNVEERVLRHG
jgi:hypothetical protein